jgi:hypothetical protein
VKLLAQQMTLRRRSSKDIHVRWRDRPRRTLRRWEADRGYGLFAITLVMAWWSTWSYAAALVTGHPDPAGDHSRWAAALGSVISLVVASTLSWVTWLYLRRPILPEKVDLGEREVTLRPPDPEDLLHRPLG